LKFTLIVPCLNELDGMKKVMPQIKREWVDQIIMLDGQSTDGSLEWAKTQNYDIYCQKEKGMWNAYREIYLSGLIKGDAVITFSPDGNSVPESIPILRFLIENGYDMVIGSRYMNGMQSLDDTPLTKVGNKIFNWMCNFGYRFRYTDSLVMLRGYRIHVIKELGFLDEPTKFQKWLIKLSNLYGWESSLSIRASKKHYKLTEISAEEPLAFRKRRQNTLVHGFVILSQILHERYGR
jgi:glycosyltransferase involved in cell wall biosynthesis